MSDNWYARRMARFRQEQPAPPPTYPQRVQPQPNTGAAPQQQFVQFQRQQPEPPPERVTIDNFWGMMHQWRGGKAHKVDPDPCPECGSWNYSGRTEGKRRGPEPAPHCFNCGYNGMYSQGLASSWQPS